MIQYFLFAGEQTAHQEDFDLFVILHLSLCHSLVPAKGCIPRLEFDCLAEVPEGATSITTVSNWPAPHCTSS